MKINKIYMLSILILLIGTVTVNAISADGLRYTSLYDTDESWCTSLYIDVSGTNITSDEYHLQDCGQSVTAHRWYCNCETDDEFDVVFINADIDTKTYIVDIHATNQHVKRVVSKNNLDNIANNATPKPNIEKFEFDTSKIDAKINSFEKKINTLKTNIDNLEKNKKVETVTNEVVTKETIENNYNDSSILVDLEIIKEKQKGFKIRFILIYILLIGIIIFVIIKTYIKKGKNE